jgi:RimJ/RimL family protein N-acetyltransferase
MITESERLYLREFIEQDAKDLYLLNNDPDVIRYTGDPPFESIDSAQQFVKEYDHYLNYGFGRWAVIRKDNNAFIGWCGLKYNEEEEIDIGFRLFKKEWGHGYATEAAKASIDYASEKLKMKHFIGRCAQDNKASISVLKKLGFLYQEKRVCHGIEDALYFVLKR